MSPLNGVTRGGPPLSLVKPLMAAVSGAFVMGFTSIDTRSKETDRQRDRQRERERETSDSESGNVAISLSADIERNTHVAAGVQSINITYPQTAGL